MLKIIGNGIIAKNFINSKFDKDTIVFASGVSNSQETKDAAFARESNLLKEVILENPKSTIVYFSTCSVNQETKSSYITHKLNMEKYIQETACNYHIFRLPQVVGAVKNTTLISFFTKSIIENKKVIIQKHATRSLLDVDDLVRITQYLVNEKIGENSIQNIASGNNTFVIDIFNEISLIIKKSGSFEYDSHGESYNISNEFILESLGKNDHIFNTDYWKSTLHKYVPILNKVLSVGEVKY